MMNESLENMVLRIFQDSDKLSDRIFFLKRLCFLAINAYHNALILGLAMIAYLLFPLFLIISLHMQRTQCVLYSVRFLTSSIMSVIAFIFIVFYAYLTESAFDFSFLYDFRFYVNLGCMIALIIVQMECRKEFQANLPLLNFSGFLSLSVIPVLSIGVTAAMGFSKSMEVDYSNQYGALYLCGLILCITIFYYGGKIKSDNLTLRKIIMLTLHTFLASLSVVMAVKMMQEFNAISLLLAANLSTAIIFIVCSYLMKEEGVSSCKSNLNTLAVMVVCYLITQFMGMHIMIRLPVEEFNLIRCIGMILMGYFYCYIRDRSILFTSRDIFILIGMMLVQFVFIG